MNTDLEPYDHEPIKVHGMVKIDSRLFVMTRWSSNKLYYVPYEFIRKHYPGLLTNYYVKNAEQMNLTVKKKKK